MRAFAFRASPDSDQVSMKSQSSHVAWIRELFTYLWIGETGAGGVLNIIDVETVRNAQNSPILMQRMGLPIWHIVCVAIAVP
jgi:hypothetical protein